MPIKRPACFSKAKCCECLEGCKIGCKIRLAAIKRRDETEVRNESETPQFGLGKSLKKVKIFTPPPDLPYFYTSSKQGVK